MSLFRKPQKGLNKKENELGPVGNEVESSVPEQLPVLPIKDTVVFPYTVIPVYVDDKIGAKTARWALQHDRQVAVFSVKGNEKKETFGPDALYTTGTVCIIHKIVPVSSQGTMVILQGVSKVELLDVQTESVPWVGTIREIPDEVTENRRVKALAKTALSTAQNIIAQTPYLPHQELQFALESLDDPLKLAYLIATVVGMKLEERQKVLSISDVESKLDHLIRVLTREDELLQIGGKIQEDIRKDFSKSQKEYFLRQKMKAIQKELGEESETAVEAEEYRKALKKIELSDDDKGELEREIDRLERMNPMSAEYQVITTYLDWVFDLPWGKYTKDKLDLKRSSDVLDKDHYGLEDAKKRILEYLAVRKLQATHTGPILCFVGPPGVGKTSLGKSVARALNRKFVRMSLGGVHDESEIRGHRRTYIGAMPGRVIQGLKRAGTKNPVFMLDEIDKMSSSFHGDPAAAMLEVLDPEQNITFRDHYIDLDFDLSDVFFIATANTLDSIHPALLDRMEIIPLSGYSLEEKLGIAKKYLWPKQRMEHGLDTKSVTITDSGLKAVIADYTREAGVRNLERELAKLCRKVAWELATGEQKKIKITNKSLKELLGPPKVHLELARRTSQPGIATGLGVTQAGGEILFIEATAMPGAKRFQVTGQLGDVMKESAHAALSLVRSRSDSLAIDKNFFKNSDIHLHIPAGAIPKDGPSAGVAMTVALASLATSRQVRNDVAMTGEISLAGLVLPVGGIKEKVLAAKRAGITAVILPKKNENDVEEIDATLLKDLEIVFADSVDEVFDIVFQS